MITDLNKYTLLLIHANDNNSPCPHYYIVLDADNLRCLDCKKKLTSLLD